MLFPKKWLKTKLVLLWLFNATPVLAHPGAWLMPEGQGQLINNFSYYRSAENVNSAGEKSANPLFEKYEYNPYLEYGYDSDLTIGGSLYANSTYNYSNSDGGKYNLDYLMAFFRQKIWQEGNFISSIEPSFAVKLQNKNDVNAEKQNYSPQLKINFGYLGDSYFTDFSIAYAAKTGGANNKVKADFAVGAKVYDDITFLNQIFAEHIIGSDYQTVGNYNLYKAQTSFIWDYNEEFSHQIGASYDLDAKNTGLGYSFIYSIWYKF